MMRANSTRATAATVTRTFAMSVRPHAAPARSARSATAQREDARPLRLIAALRVRVRGRGLVAEGV
jgi:hypothetical protein